MINCMNKKSTDTKKIFCWKMQQKKYMYQHANTENNNKKCWQNGQQNCRHSQFTTIIEMLLFEQIDGPTLLMDLIIFWTNNSNY